MIDDEDKKTNYQDLLITIFKIQKWIFLDVQR